MHSRENDDDDTSSSPIPSSKLIKGEYSKTVMKDNSSQVISSSKSSNSTTLKLDSNGSKGRNSVIGLSREVGRKMTDDGKSITSNPKQSSSSSKGILPSKKASPHISHTGTPSSTRLHKALKIDANRGKDKID